MDNQLQTTDRQSKRRGFLWGAIFTALIGANTFFSVWSNPRFETIHILDVMRLMITGAAIAVTILLLFQFSGCGPFSGDQRAGERGEESS